MGLLRFTQENSKYTLNIYNKRNLVQEISYTVGLGRKKSREAK